MRSSSGEKSTIAAGRLQHESVRDSSDQIERPSGFDEILDRWLGLRGPSTPELIRAILRSRPWGSYCHRCGQDTGEGECTDSGCGHCRSSSGLLDGVIRLGGYRGALGEAIRLLKFQRRAELANPLGKLLAGRIRQGLKGGKQKNISPLSSGSWAVTPMPMPWGRRWQRGLDHAGLLADVVGREMGLKVLRPLSKRRGCPQAELGRSARLRAKPDDYRIQRYGMSGFGGLLPNLEGLNLILVDDVLTTGRSMRAAGSILRRLGPACILAVALAVTPSLD